MPGLDQQHVDHQEADDPRTSARNARYGLMLFAIYAAFYGGYVLLSAFRPDVMETTPLAGVNLAVLYGFALILGALVLSLVYGWLCRAPASAEDDQQRGGA